MANNLHLYSKIDINAINNYDTFPWINEILTMAVNSNFAKPIKIYPEGQKFCLSYTKVNQGLLEFVKNNSLERLHIEDKIENSSQLELLEEIIKLAQPHMWALSLFLEGIDGEKFNNILGFIPKKSNPLLVNIKMVNNNDFAAIWAYENNAQIVKDLQQEGKTIFIGYSINNITKTYKGNQLDLQIESAIDFNNYSTCTLAEINNLLMKSDNAAKFLQQLVNKLTEPENLFREKFANASASDLKTFMSIVEQQDNKMQDLINMLLNRQIAPKDIEQDAVIYDEFKMQDGSLDNNCQEITDHCQIVEHQSHKSGDHVEQFHDQ